MAERALKVIDGASLRSADLTLPDLTTSLFGDQIVKLVLSAVSASLSGLTLPESLVSSALQSLNVGESFPIKEFQADVAFAVAKELINAIAHQLEDDPLVVAVLDGQTIRTFLEDEDDFAMLAEDLFTDLDTEDTGKISKKEIRNALSRMGVEMGIPPTEFPVLSEILKKHGADEEEQLGQAQFALVLQPILQDLADALAEKNIVIIQNIKIRNGSKLKKVLANEKLLNNTIDKILQECHEGNDKPSKPLIRSYLEKNGGELGLPPNAADDDVVLLYDSIFADVETKKQSASDSEKDDFKLLMKEILGKFAEQLESKPVFHDIDN
ncbi:uncharacterized protein LOC141660835 [Apium graveolens]|uniref:uncharacterized protein LOC141660835 n=1 Tax=Apium graveolens TaxID=4045 RepID=UPI003D7B5C4C